MLASLEGRAVHVEPRHTPEELAELARAEPRGRVARRLLAVRAALLGRTAAEAGAGSLLCERQVRNWVARYNAGGPGALADRPRAGRPGPLAPDQEARLAQRLRAGPTEADGVCALRGADVRRILEAEFGVARSLPAVYELLHRLGFEPLRPRPRHPRAGPEAQADFKKVCPRGSPPSPPPGPRSALRSGSRTRPGSDRRAP